MYKNIYVDTITMSSSKISFDLVCFICTRVFSAFGRWTLVHVGPELDVYTLKNIPSNLTFRCFDLYHLYTLSIKDFCCKSCICNKNRYAIWLYLCLWFDCYSHIVSFLFWCLSPRNFIVSLLNYSAQSCSPWFYRLLISDGNDKIRFLIYLRSKSQLQK